MQLNHNNLLCTPTVQLWFTLYTNCTTMVLPVVTSMGCLAHQLYSYGLPCKTMAYPVQCTTMVYLVHQQYSYGLPCTATAYQLLFTLYIYGVSLYSYGVNCTSIVNIVHQLYSYDVPLNSYGLPCINYGLPCTVMVYPVQVWFTLYKYGLP